MSDLKITCISEAVTQSHPESSKPSRSRSSPETSGVFARERDREREREIYIYIKRGEQRKRASERARKGREKVSGRERERERQRQTYCLCCLDGQNRNYGAKTGEV